MVWVVVEPLRLPIRLNAEANRNCIANGVIDNAFETVLIEAEGKHVADEPTVLEFRLGQHDVDQAEFGVASVQGALRALQHFHALQVEIIERLEVTSAERTAA